MKLLVKQSFVEGLECEENQGSEAEVWQSNRVSSAKSEVIEIICLVGRMQYSLEQDRNMVRREQKNSWESETGDKRF